NEAGRHADPECRRAAQRIGHVRLRRQFRQYRHDADDPDRYRRRAALRGHRRPDARPTRRHAGSRQAAERHGGARLHRAMSPSRTFILKPVATSLLMVAVLLAGFVAFRQLPVSALPEVDYPTIQVATTYPGASPDVMASSVTAPLERQFGQMPGLQQMTSTSSAGISIITLQFDLELSIDVAEQEVQH